MVDTVRKKNGIMKFPQLMTCINNFLYYVF